MTPTQISERRHTDPPRLWVGVILGSVLIHLFGLGMLQWLIVRQQANQVATDLIAVDIVAVTPKDSGLNRPQSSPVGSGLIGQGKNIPGSRQNQTRPYNSNPPNRQAIVPKNQVVPKNTGRVAAPSQNLQPSPTSKQTQESRSSSTLQNQQQVRVTKPQDNKKPFPLPSQDGIKRQEIGGRGEGTWHREQEGTQNHTPGRQPQRPPQPQPQPSRSPVANGGPKPKPSPWSGDKGQNSPQKPPSPSNDTSKKQERRTKPVQPVPPSSGNNNPPPSPPQSPPTTPPVRPPSPPPQQDGSLVVILSNERLPANGGKDVPDSQAKPLGNQKDIDANHYPSPVLKNLKQVSVVGVYLVIDNVGKVETTKVVRPSGNREVDRLAEDILKSWKFNPATQGGKPVYGELEVDLRIAPPPS